MSITRMSLAPMTSTPTCSAESRARDSPLVREFVARAFRHLFETGLADFQGGGRRIGQGRGKVQAQPRRGQRALAVHHALFGGAGHIHHHAGAARAPPQHRAAGESSLPPDFQLTGVQRDAGVGGERQDAAPVDGARIAGIHILARDDAASDVDAVGQIGIVSWMGPSYPRRSAETLMTAVPPAGMLTNGEAIEA